MSNAERKMYSETIIQDVTLGYIRQKLEDNLHSVAGFTIGGTDWASGVFEAFREVVLIIRAQHFKPYIDKQAVYHSWVVEVLGNPQRRAYIEEAETEGGIKLTIRDPFDETYEPIGAPFDKFCQFTGLARMVAEQGKGSKQAWKPRDDTIHGAAETGEIEAPRPSRPHWFPKGDRALARWRKSYQAIKKLREDLRKSYENLNTPNPTIDDMRDALDSMRCWRKKPSRSTVCRIVRSGDAGWLD